MKNTFVYGTLVAMAFIAVAFGLIVSSEAADESDATYYDYNNNEYTVSDGVLSITKGTNGNGVMPDFSYSSNLIDRLGITESFTVVSMDNTMTNIGSFIFNGCTNIIDVTLPSNLSSIPGYAFCHCTNLNSISLPNSITTIDYSAFEGCTSLALTSLPSGLINIYDNAFNGCTSLALTSLPSGLTTIGNSAFSDCTNIALTSIPNNVANIGTHVFVNCTGLSQLTLPSNLISIKSHLFHGCSNLNSISLPSSLNSILDYAFYGCTSLALTSIPNGVTTIGAFAFYNCSNIVLTSLPDGLTSIGASAFYNCSNIVLTSLPDGLTSIQNYTFRSCTRLALTSLPSSLRSIGQYTFMNCKNITIASLPDGLTSIGNSVFYGCTSLALTSLPNSVTSISDYAFCGCTGLTSILFPASITTIGPNAFNECTSVTSITIPNTLSSIGSNSFALGSSASQVTCHVYGCASGMLDSYKNQYTTFIYDGGYTVTYKLDGAQYGEMDTVYYGVQTSLRDKPVKEGYTVSDWTSDDATVSGTSFIMPAKNVTITATSSPITYTITFNGNGNTGGTAPADIDAAYGVQYTAPSNTWTRTNHIFSKWNTAADGSGTDYEVGATLINLTSTADATVTLYAKWIAYSHITLDKGTGTEDGSATAIFNSTTLTDISAPSNYGFHVEGYYTDSALTVKISTDNGVLIAGISGYTDDDGKWTMVSDTTLYTKWLPDDRTVTITNDISKTYDGSAVIDVTYTVSLGSGDVTIEYKKGSGSYATVKPIDAGSYTVRVSVASDGTYAAVSTSETFTIGQATITADNFNAIPDQTYTGSAIFPTMSPIAPCTANDFTVDYSDNILVGTAGVNITAKENYTGTVSLSFAIIKAEYLMTDVEFDDATVTYNGTVQSIAVAGTLPTGADGIQISVSYSEGRMTVGTILITATFATESTNYNAPAAMTATLTVIAVSDEITVTADSATKHYDGLPLTKDTYTFTENILIGNDVLSAEISGTITDFGTADNEIISITVMNGTVDVTDCYTFSESVKGTLEVTKRPVTLTSASDSKMYDGEPLTNDNVTISGEGFVGEEGADFTVTGTITDFGTADNVFTYQLKNDTSADNYDITTVTGTLSIEKRDVILTSASATKVYDGTDLTVDEVTVSGSGFVSGQGADFSVTGCQRFAGSSENTFSYTLHDDTEADNYDITAVNGTLEVTPITDVITISTDGASKKYDGTPLSKDTYTFTDGILLDGDVLTVVLGSSITDSGSIYNTVSSFKVMNGATDITDSYTFAEPVPGTLNILKRTIVLTSASDSKTYDGTVLKNSGVSLTGDGFVDNEGATFDVTGSRAHSGSTDNVFTYLLNENTKESNYNISTVFGKLEIVKRELLIKSSSDSKTYDGMPLTCSAISYGKEGKVETDDFSFVYTGSQKDAGTAPNTFTYIPTAGTYADDYSITVEYGTLTVEKRAAVITSASDSKVYDKKPLTNGRYTSEGFILGEGFSCSFTGSQTSVGTSLNEFEYALNEGTKADNYTIVQSFGQLSIKTRTVTVPEELSYVETGAEILFRIPTSDYYMVGGHSWYGKDAGTYDFIFQLDSNCAWSDPAFTGAYHVYITKAKIEHIDETGVSDVIITRDTGIRFEYTMSVTKRTDMSELRSKYTFQGEPTLSYDVKLMNGTESVGSAMPCVVKLLIPADARGTDPQIYGIIGNSAEKMSYTADGDYAVVTTNGLTEFVIAKGQTTAEQQDYTVVIIIAIALILLLILLLIPRIIRKIRRSKKAKQSVKDDLPKI